VELAVLLEQVGAHVAPAPVLQQALALDALSRPGLDWDVAALLAGESIATVAFASLTAAADDGGWLVSGATEPAVYAPAASLAVVRAATDAGEALFVVDLDATGTRPGAEPAMDLTRELGWLRFEATPATRLGGMSAVTRFVDLGAVAYAAEMLGIAARVLDLSADYARERVQFGRPIGSFQAVKHRCADMLVDVEGMRSAVYYAAWSIGAGDAEASVAASTAKCWCSDAGKRVCASGLQVHGGIGFTWEHDLHLFMKRAQLDEVSFGDASWHRTRLAGLLRGRVEAGEPVI